MQVACIIKRPKGTEVTFNDGTAYHFKPEDPTLKVGSDEYLQAPHVAEVENEDHLAAFLAANTAYKLYRPGTKVPTAKSDLELLRQQQEADERAKAAAAQGSEQVPDDKKLAIDLPDFSEMKKAQVIAWVQANLPHLDVNPQMPLGGIIQKIRDNTKPLTPPAA